MNLNKLSEFSKVARKLIDCVERTGASAEEPNLNRSAFRRLASGELFETQKSTGLVIHVLPPIHHTRIAAQQGTFLINCNPYMTFEDSLRQMIGTKFDDTVQRITFECGLAEQILADLFRYNIHPLSLMPGMDGLAEMVALKNRLKPYGRA